jgi:Carboxypeptidase regulatory-like domain
MKSTNRFALLMRVVLIGGLAANMVLAQATGRLSGSVTDPSGAVVAGATVGLMLPGGAQPVLTAVTNAEWLFSMIGVPAGTYQLTVTVQGYKKHVEEAVTVRPGQEVALGGVKLEIGQVSETIQVTETQSVQTSNAEVSQSFTSQQIKGLPLS